MMFFSLLESALYCLRDIAIKTLCFSLIGFSGCIFLNLLFKIIDWLFPDDSSNDDESQRKE